MAVSVVTMGAEVKTVPFSPKMTVAQAMSTAGVAQSTGTVTLDGKAVKDSTKDQVRENSKIVVTPRVSNG